MTRRLQYVSNDRITCTLTQRQISSASHTTLMKLLSADNAEGHVHSTPAPRKSSVTKY